MTLRRWATVGTFIFVMGILFSFQNCMQSLPNSAEQPSKSGTPTTDLVPFAFEAKPDLVGFNSCYAFPRQGFIPKVFFSFKFKADSAKGGVGFSKEYKTFASQNGLTTDEKKFNTIYTSANNRGAKSQLAFRTIKNLSTRIFEYNDPPIQYSDIIGTVNGWDYLSDRGPLLSILTADRGNNLIREYTPDGASSPSPFSIQLAFGLGRIGEPERTDGLFNELRIGGPSALVLGFNVLSLENDNQIVAYALDTGKSTGGDAIVAPARQYQFTFNYPSANTTQRMAGRNARVLSGVDEKLLNTSPAKPGSQWYCEPYLMEFKIAPYESSGAEGMGCPDPFQANFKEKYQQIPQGSDQARQFSALNSMLNDGQSNSRWIIDVESRCVYPVQGNARACYVPGYPIAQDNEPCGAGTTSQCPHYVSVCRIY